MAASGLQPRRRARRRAAILGRVGTGADGDDQRGGPLLRSARRPKRPTVLLLHGSLGQCRISCISVLRGARLAGAAHRVARRLAGRGRSAWERLADHLRADGRRRRGIARPPEYRQDGRSRLERRGGHRSRPGQLTTRSGSTGSSPTRPIHSLGRVGGELPMTVRSQPRPTVGWPRTCRRPPDRNVGVWLEHDATSPPRPSYIEAELKSVAVPVLNPGRSGDEFIKPDEPRRMAELTPAPRW